MAKYNLTPQEEALIAEAIQYGFFSQPGQWEEFQERLRNDWSREGAVERALGDTSYGAARELRGMWRGLMDPGIGIEAGREHFAQHGIVGGVGELAKSVITSPFQAAGTLISTGGLGDRPLQTLTGLAAFVPVGRLGTAALGYGTRGTRLGAGLQRAAGSPLWTGASRGAEALDLATGIEEWTLELGADVAMDASANALSNALKGQTTIPGADFTQPPPQQQPPTQPTTQPPTQPPQQPGPTPPALTGQTYDQQQANKPTSFQPKGIYAPLISELWFAKDGSHVSPNTRGSKQTYENQRKWVYGDITDEQSIGSMTVKRVPNPDGKFDNRHWQVWFTGGWLGGVNDQKPINFTAEHGIDSYAGARDAVISQIQEGNPPIPQPGTRDFGVDINSMWQQHQNNRAARTERREQNRQTRTQPAEQQPDTEQQTLIPEQVDETVSPESEASVAFLDNLRNSAIDLVKRGNDPQAVIEGFVSDVGVWENLETHPEIPQGTLGPELQAQRETWLTNILSTDLGVETTPTETPVEEPETETPAEEPETEQTAEQIMEAFVEEQAAAYVDAIVEGRPRNFASNDMNEAVAAFQKEHKLTPQQAGNLFRGIMARANELMPTIEEAEPDAEQTVSEEGGESDNVESQETGEQDTGDSDAETTETPVTEEPSTSTQPEKVSDDEAMSRVWAAIPEGEQVHIDNITRETGLSVGQVSTALLMHELNGQVQQHPGKMFSKTEGATYESTTDESGNTTDDAPDETGENVEQSGVDQTETDMEGETDTGEDEGGEETDTGDDTTGGETPGDSATEPEQSEPGGSEAAGGGIQQVDSTEGIGYEQIRYIGRIGNIGMTPKPVMVPGYKLLNTGIDFAELVVHRKIQGKEAKGGWVVSDVETGLSITGEFDTREMAVEKAILSIEETGETEYRRLVDEQLQEQRYYYDSLPDRKHIDMQWFDVSDPTNRANHIVNLKNPELWVKRKGADFEYMGDGGGKMTVSKIQRPNIKANRQYKPNMAKFTGIAGIPEGFTLELPDGLKAHQARFEAALPLLTEDMIVSPLVEETISEPEQTITESTETETETVQTEEPTPTTSETVTETEETPQTEEVPEVYGEGAWQDEYLYHISSSEPVETDQPGVYKVEAVPDQQFPETTITVHREPTDTMIDLWGEESPVYGDPEVYNLYRVTIESDALLAPISDVVNLVENKHYEHENPEILAIYMANDVESAIFFKEPDAEHQTTEAEDTSDIKKIDYEARYVQLRDDPEGFAKMFGTNITQRDNPTSMIEYFDVVLNSYKDMNEGIPESTLKIARAHFKKYIPKYEKTENAKSWTRIIHDQVNPDQDEIGMINNIKGYRVVNTGYDGIEFYMFKALDREGKPTGRTWHVIESRTGLKIGSGDTRDEAVSSAFSRFSHSNVEKIRENIETTVASRELYYSHKNKKDWKQVEGGLYEHTNGTRMTIDQTPGDKFFAVAKIDFGDYVYEKRVHSTEQNYEEWFDRAMKEFRPEEISSKKLIAEIEANKNKEQEDRKSLLRTIASKINTEATKHDFEEDNYSHYEMDAGDLGNIRVRLINDWQGYKVNIYSLEEPETFHWQEYRTPDDIENASDSLTEIQIIHGTVRHHINVMEQVEERDAETPVETPSEPEEQKETYSQREKREFVEKWQADPTEYFNWYRGVKLDPGLRTTRPQDDPEGFRKGYVDHIVNVMEKLSEELPAEEVARIRDEAMKPFNEYMATLEPPSEPTAPKEISYRKGTATLNLRKVNEEGMPTYPYEYEKREAEGYFVENLGEEFGGLSIFVHKESNTWTAYDTTSGVRLTLSSYPGGRYSDTTRGGAVDMARAYLNPREGESGGLSEEQRNKVFEEYGTRPPETPSEIDADGEAKRQAAIDMGLDPDDLPDDFDADDLITENDWEGEFNDYKKKSSDANWQEAFPNTKTERLATRQRYNNKVDSIIAQAPPEARDSLFSLSEILNSGKYFQLRGREVRSVEEAAVIAQFIRNPLVESTLILIRKEGKIVGADWFSLGKSDESTTGSLRELEKLMNDLEADDFIRIHNHPSTQAFFSTEDLQAVATAWHWFGNKYAGDVIVDDGTYAYSYRGTDDKWRTLNDQPLDLQNAKPFAPWLGAYFKTQDNWTTFIVTDANNRIVSTVEKHGYTDLSTTNMMLTAKGYIGAAKGTKVHVFVGQRTGRGAKDQSKLRGISNYNFVGSVWDDGVPIKDRKQTLGTDLPDDVDTYILRDYQTRSNKISPGSYFVPHSTVKGEVNPSKVGIFNRLRGLFDPAASIKAKLDGYSPKAALNLERARREYMSGYRNLETLGPVGAEFREAAEHVLRMQEQGTARDLNDLESHRQALIKLTKQRAKAQPGASRDSVLSILGERIWRHIEENTTIDDDPELAEIAEGWKNTWRKLNKAHVMAMMELRRLVEERGEQLLIYSASGAKPRAWTPLLRGYIWHDDSGMFERRSDKAMVSLEQALDETLYLYMPHNYPRGHWDAIKRELEVNNVLDQLTEAEQDPDVRVPGYRYIVDPHTGKESWEFTRTGEVYDTKQAAIAGARSFWNSMYAIADSQLAIKDSDVLGRFGNLELARETPDRLYSRDIMSLLDHSALFWRRFAEISTWGQTDPVTGKHPRLGHYLSRIEQSTFGTDERALKVVIDTLLSHEMFQDLPTFKEGDRAAYRAIRNWKHPTREAKYWGNVPPPPPDYPVDIERMLRENPGAFTPQVMESLQRVGLIEKKTNGEWTIKGIDRAAKDTTFVKIMMPMFQKRDLRMKTLEKIAQGLGHWEQNNEIDRHSNNFWRILNGTTTALTLGFHSAAQNIVEVPWLAAMSGAKNTALGLQRLAADKEFRQMLPRLGAALNKARDYLSQGELQAKYMGMIGFTATEKWSRLMGAAVGWETARDAIQKYINNPNNTSRERLSELMISVEAVEGYRQALSTGQAPNLDALVQEAEKRTLEGAMMLGGLRPPDAPAPSHELVDIIGDEMAKSARYVSTRTFKGYNALSMPHFLTKKNPMLRTFFKFKAWAAQMHQFVWEQTRYATAQARKGNFGPALRLATGAGFLMGSTAVFTAVWNALRGREREEDRNRILEALAQSQAAGAISTIIEISQISEGNPYRASQMISSFFGSPTISIISRIGGEAAAFDVKGLATQSFLKIPFVREIPRIEQLKEY